MHKVSLKIGAVQSNKLKKLLVLGLKIGLRLRNGKRTNNKLHKDKNIHKLCLVDLENLINFLVRLKINFLAWV